MAAPKWAPTAKPVADVWTLTPGGTIEAGDIFITTIGGKSVSVSATSTTVASVCDDLVAALQALDVADYPEFAEYTFADATTAVTATANKTGIPGTISVTTTESNGGAADAQTYVATHTTTGTGPNSWDNTANWSTGAIPANSDTVTIENSDVDILYGIDQNAVAVTSLTIPATYTGKIGLPRRNPAGYAEYRETYLKIGSTTVTIGQGNGPGSRRIKLNVGSTACTCNVNGSGSELESGVEAILFIGSDSGNVLNVTQGSVGVAIFAGETANLSGGVRIGYESNQTSDAKVTLGSGVTLATVIQTGGEAIINGSMTTVNRHGGEMTQRGTGTLTTLNNFGGTFFDESTGTMTTLNNYADFDRRRVISSKTITNSKMYAGARLWAPSGSASPAFGITFTNATEFHGCAPGDDRGTLFDVGMHKKFTWADI
jgi:hypothetical protein